MLSRPFHLLAVCLVAALNAHAAVVRTNGKGGGPWSAPATWDGGKVPAGEAVSILNGDIVDFDAAASNRVDCEELVIDSQGALRIVGEDDRTVTFQIRDALKIFGGMIVDFSKAPRGGCAFQWTTGKDRAPELLFNENCKVRWKGAISSNGLPNVQFRISGPNGPMLSFALGGKMLVECETVTLDGFYVSVSGVDGSGLKYNEAATFRNCRFVRSPITFQGCSKIKFVGNTSVDSPGAGLYLNQSQQMHIVSNVVERALHFGIRGTAFSDSEFIGNTIRGSNEGADFTGCHEIFISGDHFEANRLGIMINSCGRVTMQGAAFAGNTTLDIRTAFDRPGGGPWRFFDCTFPKPAPISISAEGLGTVELLNSPLVTYAKLNTIIFNAYLDVLVTDDQDRPLSRMPVRVLSDKKVIASSRTDSTGHTPLPSSHRPMVVTWHKFNAADKTAPAASMTYQLEVDGTTEGYSKQTVPLVVDASFVRPDPNKPTKTVTVKLTKAK